MVKTKSKWIGLSWLPARELIRAQVSLHLARLWKQPIICTCFIHGSVVCIQSHFFLLLFYQEAIAAESFIESTPMCIEKGDLERGFADSDHVLQGEMRMGGQVCLLRLKMTIALYLVNGTQRAKEEPHAIHFCCHLRILSSARIHPSYLSQYETSHLPRLK